MSEDTPKYNTEQIPQAQQNAEMSIVDIQSLLKIVEVASTRGAFKSSEFSSIGQVCDRVSAFLAKLNEIQAKEQADVKTASASEKTEPQLGE